MVPDARRPAGARDLLDRSRAARPRPTARRSSIHPFYSDQARPREAAAAVLACRAAPRPPPPWANESRDGTRGLPVAGGPGLSTLRPGRLDLDIETTCLNRDLPRRLPFGGGRPRLQLTEGRGPGQRIRCLTPPTRTLRAGLETRGALEADLASVAQPPVAGRRRRRRRRPARNPASCTTSTDSPDTRDDRRHPQRTKAGRIVRGQAPQAMPGGLLPRAGRSRSSSTRKDFRQRPVPVRRRCWSGSWHCSARSTRLPLVSSRPSKRTRGSPGRWPPRMGERVLV